MVFTRCIHYIYVEMVTLLRYFQSQLSFYALNFYFTSMYLYTAQHIVHCTVLVQYISLNNVINEALLFLANPMASGQTPLLPVYACKVLRHRASYSLSARQRAKSTNAHLWFYENQLVNSFVFRLVRKYRREELRNREVSSSTRISYTERSDMCHLTTLFPVPFFHLESCQLVEQCVQTVLFHSIELHSRYFLAFS